MQPSPIPSKNFEANLRRRGLLAADFNWLLLQLARIPALPDYPEVKVPETVIWDQGIPQCILKMRGPNRVVKQSAVKMSKRYIQQHFNEWRPATANNTPAHRGSVGRFSEASTPRRSVFDRLATDARSYRTPRPSLKERAKMLQWIGYKSVLRFVGPQCEGVRSLTDKMMSDVMTKWPSKKLKRIRSFHSYIRTVGEKKLVIRVKYEAGKAKADGGSRARAKQTLTGICSPSGVKRAYQCSEERVEKCKEWLERVAGLMREHCRVDLVEVEAEFLTTDVETWMDHAWGIVYRPVPPKDKTDENLQKALVMAEKRVLIKRLNEKDEKEEGKVLFIDAISRAIGKHIEDIKEKTGLKVATKPEPADTRSDDVFRVLRPGTPLKLTQILDPACNLVRAIKQAVPAEAVARTRDRLFRSDLMRGRTARTPGRRVRVTKGEYASIVSDGLRVLHNVLPKRPKSYSEWKQSLANLQDAVAPIHPRNYQRLATPRTKSRRSSCPDSPPTTAPPTSRKNSIASEADTSARVIKCMAKYRYNRVQNKLEIV